MFGLGGQDSGTPLSCPFSFPSLSNEAALNALCVYDSGVKAVCTWRGERCLLGLGSGKALLHPRTLVSRSV